MSGVFMEIRGDFKNVRNNFLYVFLCPIGDQAFFGRDLLKLYFTFENRLP